MVMSTCFVLNLVQKFKSSVRAEILYQDYPEYVKLNGGVYVFCVRPYFASFVQKIPFDVTLVNPPAVYWQRLETSGFSCLY